MLFRSKKLILATTLAAGMAAGQVMAGDTEAAIGGGLGGAVGAVIGNEVGGTNGAIIGAGIGGATGAVIGNRSDDRNDRYRYVDDDHRRRDHRHYDNRYDHRYDARGRGNYNGSFCPPGQAKKGRC